MVLLSMTTWAKDLRENTEVGRSKRFVEKTFIVGLKKRCHPPAT